MPTDEETWTAMVVLVPVALDGHSSRWPLLSTGKVCEVQLLTKYKKNWLCIGKHRNKGWLKPVEKSLSLHPPIWCARVLRALSGSPNVFVAITCPLVYSMFGGRNWPAAKAHVCTVTFSLPVPAKSAYGDLFPWQFSTIVEVQLGENVIDQRCRSVEDAPWVSACQGWFKALFEPMVED